jgi:ATP-binding cassette, subfamily B, bacterial PglK
MSNSTINSRHSPLLNLWHHLPKRRQKQFYLLLIIMIFASFLEIVSIGAVVPFLGVLTAPEQVYQNQLLQPIIKYLKLTEPNQLVLPLTVGFVLAILLAGIVRLALLYLMTRLSYASGADLSINIYRRTLYQGYPIHAQRNSSEVINGIITKTNAVISQVLTPALRLISSLIILLGIIIALFLINIYMSLITLIGFGILYWIVIRFTRQWLKDSSECIASQSTQMIKSLQEGLGGIRDVLVDGTQQFYCQLYRNADLPLRRATGTNIFISGAPRYIMEMLGMSLIAILACSMSRFDGISTAIPMIGALALGAQRLLPALQQAYSAFSTMKGADSSLRDIVHLLDQPLPEYICQPAVKPISFNHSITLKQINFEYTSEKPQILRDINLTINKGLRIGFIGTTGSGKSTLLDIIMGLLSPTSGELLIDDKLINENNMRSWQSHIAHVSQHIYLSDSTIEENIAFGISKEKINHGKVKKAAQKAQISELIESWKDGYQTFVGERGIRLSGGQRQRIGIARALYKEANVLIFDEATSALDNETEQAVMDAITGLSDDLTILIIAHRLTTLKSCDKIIKLDKSQISAVGAYKEMVDDRS